MDYSVLRAMILDGGLSDDDLYPTFKAVMADRFDESGAIIPLTDQEVAELEELSELNRQNRPALFHRLQAEFVAEHTATCPACQAMKASQEQEK